MDFGSTEPKGHERSQLVSHTPNTHVKGWARQAGRGSICELSGALNTTIGARPSGCLGHLPGVRRNGRALRTPEAPHTRRPQVGAQERLNRCWGQAGGEGARPVSRCRPERADEAAVFCLCLSHRPLPPLYCCKWTRPPPSVSSPSSRSSVTLVTFTCTSTPHGHNSHTK